MSSVGIGGTLRRERERQGISLDDIARNTRIPRRFLDAIEAENFDGLPGLVFTRNFVRQYAEALRLDAEPIVGGLPKLDESSIQLPDPPKHKRRRTRYTRPGSGFRLLVWSSLAIAAGVFLYAHFNKGDFNAEANMRAGIAALRDGLSAASRIREVTAAAVNAPESPTESQTSKEQAPTAPEVAQGTAPEVADKAPASSVQVVVTALQEAWVELSADGKTSFAGTLMPNEKKEISAAAQVKIVAGNAGGVKVSLNGKPLDPLGPVGQVRVVRLTAEGPQFLEVAHPVGTEPDPL